MVCAFVSAPASSSAEPSPQLDTKSHFNLRVGAATTDDNGRATICLEVSVWRQLSVEGCGTGSGFLHQDDGSQMAHFRAKWALWRSKLPRGDFIVQAGLGFAELEIGADEPGFDFGSPDGNSASGGEVAASVQYQAPFGRGFELVASGSIGIAYISGANELPTSPSRAQPFASFELGVGW